MNSKYESIKIINSAGQENLFKNIKSLTISTDNGIIEIVHDGGNFVMLFDRMRYFEVGFSAPQAPSPNFKICHVKLVGLNRENAQPISINDVINYEWKADQGLLMLFGTKATLGVHLDHLVSFSLEK